MGVIIQNFSIALGDDMDVPFTPTPNTAIDYHGADISWAAYAMADAVVDIADGAIILKQSATGGISVVDSPESFTVHMLSADTAGLLGNYYHEARLVSAGGAISTLIKGVMTVTQTALFNSTGHGGDVVVQNKLEQLIISWDSNTPVADGSSYALLSSQWTTATILSCSYMCSVGSFDVEIDLVPSGMPPGSAVGGLAGLTVGQTTQTSYATGNNSLSPGDAITVLISGVSSPPPEEATLQINLLTSLT